MVALYATTTDIYKKNMQSFSLFTSHFSHLTFHISLPYRLCTVRTAVSSLQQRTQLTLNQLLTQR